MHTGLLFAGLFLTNPAALYVLGVSAFTAAWATLLVLLALQAAHRRWRFGLPTVYLVNVFALASIGLHAELVVRLRFADYVADNLYRWENGYYFNRPGLRQTLRDKEFQVSYLTNREGYRIGQTEDPERSPSQVDWLVIGDSYTQGAQVEFEDLYTTHLATAFPDQVVLNAGISGWGLYEALHFLRSRGRELRPRVVVLQVANFNDFMKVRPHSASFSDWLMQESFAARLLLQDLKYEHPTNLPLGRWVEPFYATDADNRKYNIFYGPSSPEKEADLRAVGSAIRAIQSEVDGLGAALVVVQLPTKEQVSFTYLEEAVRALRIDPRHVDLEAPNRLLRTLTNSLEVPLVDALPAFQSNADFPYFAFDEHLNPEGHRALAEVLAPVLARYSTGPGARRLSRHSFGDRYPTVLAGGDRVLYQSARDGTTELFVADTALAEERRLTTDEVDETHPVALAAGGGFVFAVGDAASGQTRLWRADTAARHPVPLINDTRVCGAIPGAAPDGRWLVYPEWPCDRRTPVTTLVRLWLGDGRRERLPQAAPEIWRPVVSPDGGAVAYIARIGRQLDLYELDLARRTTRRLTDTPYDEWDPTYTPDGRELIYAAQADGNWDLFRLARGSGARRRVTSTRGDEWDPHVAPDGVTLWYGGEYGLFRGIYTLRLPP